MPDRWHAPPNQRLKLAARETKHLSIAIAATLAGAYAGYEFIFYAWLTATPSSSDTLPTLQRRAVAWGIVFLAAGIVGLINLIIWWHKRRQNHQSNLSRPGISNDPH